LCGYRRAVPGLWRKSVSGFAGRLGEAPRSVAGPFFHRQGIALLFYIVNMLNENCQFKFAPLKAAKTSAAARGIGDL
jgi:hypothetical protein